MRQKNVTMADTIHERIKLLVDKLADGKNTIFAANLGVSEANIRSYIRGVVPKADILSKIVSYYDINADWLLTGRGSIIKTKGTSDNEEPLYETFPEIKGTKENPDKRKKEEENKSDLINKLLDRISEQAEEIGRLKAQIDELERRREDDASDAASSKSALVG